MHIYLYTFINMFMYNMGIYMYICTYITPRTATNNPSLFGVPLPHLAGAAISTTLHRMVFEHDAKSTPCTRQCSRFVECQLPAWLGIIWLGNWDMQIEPHLTVVALQILISSRAKLMKAMAVNSLARNANFSGYIISQPDELKSVLRARLVSEQTVSEPDC